MAHFERFRRTRECVLGSGVEIPGDHWRCPVEFPGCEGPTRLIFLAKKLWEWLRRLAAHVVGPARIFQKWKVSTETENKRGRPTIPDNFLMGSRNAWQSLFEEYWAEIGWLLILIRDTRSSTVDDVRAALAPIKGRPHSEIATPFWSGSPEPTKVPDLRANRIELSKLDIKTQRMRAEFGDLQRLCQEADRALEGAATEVKEAIQVEVKRRQGRMQRADDDIKAVEEEYRYLDKSVRDKEAYLYSSELLDFLSGRRYAIEPLNLANALAGLPEMKWRQSFSRCSEFHDEHLERFSYRVFRAIDLLWNRRGNEFEEAPIEFFRTEILKRSNFDTVVEKSLCGNWRDLRLAITECWNTKQQSSHVPYAISSVYLERLNRLKSDADRVAESCEAVPCPSLQNIRNWPEREPR
jgi:hypothetical protein